MVRVVYIINYNTVPTVVKKKNPRTSNIDLVYTVDNTIPNYLTRIIIEIFGTVRLMNI